MDGTASGFSSSSKMSFLMSQNWTEIEQIGPKTKLYAMKFPRSTRFAQETHKKSLMRIPACVFKPDERGKNTILSSAADLVDEP